MDSIAILNDQNTFAVDYKVYGFDRNKKEGKLLFTKETGFNFVLDSFDALLGRNTYLSQIIEFTITTEQNNAPEGNIELDIPVDANFLADDTGKLIADYMSNVIEFRTCLGSYIDSNGSKVDAFTMGNYNRYYREFDPSSEKLYVNNDDKIYQEVHYELENSKYAHYHYIDENEIINMPTDETAFIQKMKEIDNVKVNVNKRNLHIVVPAKSGSTYTVPYGYKSATFYLQFDYSEILTNFYASNKNATISSSSEYQVNSDFNRIKVGVIK